MEGFYWTWEEQVNLYTLFTSSDNGVRTKVLYGNFNQWQIFQGHLMVDCIASTPSTENIVQTRVDGHCPTTNRPLLNSVQSQLSPLVLVRKLLLLIRFVNFICWRSYTRRERDVVVRKGVSSPLVIDDV
eukprot:TRINITY_DN4028_c0_g1_i1.p1 TRINITY_DN4028_c0_g1~~TRINITY_DN4028_c0_g1_i1.p1  ORF type:complete len:129 (-),score=7.06 TRINITY_DN4028_c0_g1_i1:150-536(-)